MPHPESEHSLMIEVARLQQDLREARAQIGKEREAWVAANARADAANSKLAATDVERLQALSALAAARRALTTIEEILTDCGYTDYAARVEAIKILEALGAPASAAGEDSK